MVRRRAEAMRRFHVEVQELLTLLIREPSRVRCIFGLDAMLSLLLLKAIGGGLYRTGLSRLGRLEGPGFDVCGIVLRL
jgi:hypothetical protein